MSATTPLDELTEDVLEAAAQADPENPLSDEAIRDAIAQEFANRPAPQTKTLSDLYSDAVMLVSGAMGYREARLRNETNAVRIYELTLMWALNNRGQAAQPILPEEIGGTSEPDLPAPHETIEPTETED